MSTDDDLRPPNDDEMFDIALKVTDEVLGEGTYADLHRLNNHPGVRAAIARAEHPVVDLMLSTRKPAKWVAVDTETGDVWRGVDLEGDPIPWSWSRAGADTLEAVAKIIAEAQEDAGLTNRSDEMVRDKPGNSGTV